VTKLRLARDLSLPLEAVTEKLGFLGRTGSGKTYAAQLLAEQLHDAGAQFVALDPVGKWWALRLAADGKAAGLSIPVFGGLHGDVPLEPAGGKLVADLLVDRGISAVVDVSQFESDAAKARFVSDFGDRLFWRKKAQSSALHVFIEEAQEFVPQNPGKEERMMLHHWTRIQKLGRNFGIGTSLLSQRPQEVNKKVLNQTEILFVFQLTGTHERKAVEAWIGDKGLDEDIAAELPKLKCGHPHVWSPALLQISRVVEINAKRTFDASSTPKVGARAQVQELAPIDLDQIRKQMAATIERAKAEDPKELRRQLAERDRRIRELERAKPAAAAPASTPKRVEVPVLKDGQVKRLERVAAAIAGAGEKLASASGQLVTVSREIVEGLRRIPTNGHRPPLPSRVLQTSATPRPSPARREPRAAGAGEASLSRSQQRILNALAWLASIGRTEADKTLVALMADQSPTSGGYFNNLGVLRSAGLVDYPAGGLVRLTEDGAARAEPVDIPTTPEELHRQLFAKLSSSQVAILRVLIENYPTALSKDDVADAAGQSRTSGGYFNNLGRLRSLGLIDYPSPGQVVGLPALMLEAAR
jgi:hypothetical protein